MVSRCEIASQRMDDQTHVEWKPTIHAITQPNKIVAAVELALLYPNTSTFLQMKNQISISGLYEKYYFLVFTDYCL